MSEFNLDAIRQPEYTGENRCPPCTVVNLLLAGVFNVLLGQLWLWVGVLGFGLSVGLIYFRGYLVPGTPELTQRYLPAPVLALFGKQPQSTVQRLGVATADADPQTADSLGIDDDLDLETELLEAGIVTSCGDDLCLTEEFESAWYDRIDDLTMGDCLGRLADLLGRNVDDLSVDKEEDIVVILDNGTPVLAWESETAFRAVMAAVRELRITYPDWDALSIELQDRVLNGLLAFIDRCPSCDGTVSLSTSGVSSCCTSGQVAQVACEACETTFLKLGV